ncbi:ABC transporter substrate-binding protein [Streptomyces endophyticus]|uniref:Sugar ABC transporter substrate-binding protein n=1 Tax=Streptomyces endophyticus TaxID=714166 RepID=A0ABU6FCK8_9ACTN|nr:sugar ABC transporter substrate-binding protein [Streptomyces endophyticus]MEB8341357.1 sugar ABC transporter substrate-binding protein [Streptomyces endophyticus]
MPQTPTRRKVLTWATATAALPALAACGESAGSSRMSKDHGRKPGQKVTLRFWTWVPLQKAVALWNKRNPDIQVVVQLLPGGTTGGYQKMHSSLKAGNPADLAQVEYYALPEFMLDGGLTNLSDFGADKLKDRYVDWQWKQGVFAGKTYAIPQASGPMGLFYRKDLLKKWDIDVPRTWDEYRRAAKQVKKHGSYMTAFPPANAQWFASFAWQRGAHWVRTEGDTWIVDLTSPESLEVADYWDGLVRDGLALPTQDSQSAFFKGLQSGQLATWPAAQWYDALIRGNAPRTKGKWAVAELPQWEAGAHASANWGGSSTAILQGSQHPVEALKFAHWLNTDPDSLKLLVAAGYGWPAAKIDLAETPLGKPDPFFGGQRYNEVFQLSDRNVDTSWRYAPTTTPSFAHIQDNIGLTLGGSGTFADALRDAEDKFVDDLKAKGLKARSAR